MIINYTGIVYYSTWGEDRLFYMNYDLGDGCLPISLGTISYTVDGNSYRETLADLIISMSKGAAFGEPYASGFDSLSSLQTIVISGGEDADNAELIQWLAENATLVERDISSSPEINNLNNTAWYFKDDLDFDALEFGVDRVHINVEFTIGMTVSDMVYLMFGDAVSAKTWSELVLLFPVYLEEIGATNVDSNIVITNENDNFVLIGYDGTDFSPSENIIWYSTVDDGWYSHLPDSTGNVSLIYDDEDYEFTLEEFLYLFGPRASLTENYWYGAWASNAFREVYITGGEDIAEDKTKQTLSLQE